jgi:hypothetical protein
MVTTSMPRRVKDPADLIHEFAHAVLYACAHDEMALDAKVPNPDQILMRFGKDYADCPNGVVGMIMRMAGDILTGGDNPTDQDYPRRSLNWAMDFVNEEPPGWPAGQRVPCVRFCLQPHATIDAQDSDEVKAFFISAVGVWSTVPLYAPNLTGDVLPPPTPLPPASSDHLVSPQGTVQSKLHDDGNLVIYQVDVDPWHALWSSQAGHIADKIPVPPANED